MPYFRFRLVKEEKVRHIVRGDQVRLLTRLPRQAEQLVLESVAPAKNILGALKYFSKIFLRPAQHKLLEVEVVELERPLLVAHGFEEAADGGVAEPHGRRRELVHDGRVQVLVVCH